MNGYAWMKAIARGMDKARSFGLAAEMSFWLFLSLIPLAAVLGLVAARFAVAHFEALGGALEAAPNSVDELIASQLGKVAKWNGGTVAPVAAVTFVWLAASGVHSVFDGLEVQVGVTRPWWKKRLLAMATCVALSIGVALLALLGTGIEWLFHLAGQHVPAFVRDLQWSGLGRIVRLVLGALIVFGLVAGTYWIGVPRKAQRKLPILPGAALAVVFHVAVGYAYGLYLSQVGSGDAYQAGLAVIGVTLMTLYFFCVGILAGAELNRLLGERRTKQSAPDPPEPHAKADPAASAMV